MKHIASLAFLFLTACTTMSPMMPKEQCAITDWEKLGFQDGARGEDPNFVDNHRYACRDSGAPIDETKYEIGRKRGLLQYCTPESLYDVGQKGRPYRDVCDPKLQVYFQQGREHLGLMRERREAQASLERRQQELNDDHSVVGDISKGIHLLNGESQTSAEQERIDRIDDKIYKSQKLAPPGVRVSSPETDAQAQLQVLSALKPLAAGLMGGIIGFGSGHAIMGTYSQRGFIFTGLDLATIAGFAVVAHNCPSSTDASTGRTTSSENKGCGAATAAAVISLIGIRIWEGIDAARTPVRLALVPVGETLGPSLLARW